MRSGISLRLAGSESQSLGSATWKVLRLDFVTTSRFFAEDLKGRVLLGSTVSGSMGWLFFFVFYWRKTCFGWFG